MPSKRSRLFCLAAAFALAASGRAPLPAQTAGYDIYLPHIAVGGGYTALLELSDPVGLGTQTADISFFDNNGSPLPVRIDGAAPAASLRLALGRNEEEILTLTSDATSPVIGWVRIAIDRGSKVSAALRFLYGGGLAAPGDAVGIIPSGVQRVWYILADRRSPQSYPGVALANPNAFPVDVEFNFYQGPNRVLGTASVRRSIPSLGHLAIFVHELFPVNFSGVGTLEVYGSQGNIAVTALLGSGAQYSSLPAQPAVEAWDYTVATPSGVTVERGNWCWKYNESTGFHGVASIDERRVDLRGSFQGNRFELVRFASAGDSAEAELHVYQGTLELQGDRALIRGNRLEIGAGGGVLRTTPFIASRLGD